MTTHQSHGTTWTNLALGYLGLFLIGLIGWLCDRVIADPSRVPDHAVLQEK